MIIVRILFFSFTPWINSKHFFMIDFKKHTSFALLDTIPGILYFSTYTLLILFWLILTILIKLFIFFNRFEIIYYSKNQSSQFFSSSIRIFFLIMNIISYSLLLIFWITSLLISNDSFSIEIILNIYFISLYLFASLGFFIYGRKLYILLKKFPIESRGRNKKIKEVKISIHFIYLFF